MSERSEKLIWGYIREHEKEYRLKTVPDELYHMIYLYKLCDVWNTKYSNNGCNNVAIDRLGTSLKILSFRCITTYGSMVMNKGKHTWNIKIASFNRNGWGDGGICPYVGIIKDTEDQLFYYSDKDSWDKDGIQLCAGGNSGKVSLHYHYYQQVWDERGHILEIVLDLDERWISFKVKNSNRNAVILENIEPANYRLALTVESCPRSEFVFV